MHVFYAFLSYSLRSSIFLENSKFISLIFISNLFYYSLLLFIASCFSYFSFSFCWSSFSSYSLWFDCRLSILVSKSLLQFAISRSCSSRTCYSSFNWFSRSFLCLSLKSTRKNCKINMKMKRINVNNGIFYLFFAILFNFFQIILFVYQNSKTFL